VLLALLLMLVTLFGLSSELVCPIEVDSAASYKATIPFNFIENSSIHAF
jgi:hypothetical protein